MSEETRTKSKLGILSTTKTSILIPTDSYPDLTPFLQQVPASRQWGASTTEGLLANPALRFSILRRRI
jgi:hypothetical protein